MEISKGRTTKESFRMGGWNDEKDYNSLVGGPCFDGLRHGVCH
jgi:hypothetical protein